MSECVGINIEDIDFNVNVFKIARNGGAQVILSGVRPNVRATIEKYGLDKKLGADHIQPHITPALEKAREILAAGDGATA